MSLISFPLSKLLFIRAPYYWPCCASRSFFCLIVLSVFIIGCASRYNIRFSRVYRRSALEHQIGTFA